MNHFYHLTLTMLDEHDYLRKMFDYHGFDDIVDKLYQEYLTSLNEELAKKETSFDSAFQGAQAAFAKKNNILIEDNKLQKKIDNN